MQFWLGEDSEGCLVSGRARKCAGAHPEVGSAGNAEVDEIGSDPLDAFPGLRPKPEWRLRLPVHDDGWTESRKVARELARKRRRTILATNVPTLRDRDVARNARAARCWVSDLHCCMGMEGGGLFLAAEALLIQILFSYLHRDVKPENFAIGRSPESRRVFVLDLGMVREWRRPDGTPHRPRESAPFRGNLKYASVNALKQQEQGRCDDLWAWFYKLIDLTCGSLPWPPMVSPFF